MKTKERILQASLQLFNEEGEAHVTTVDIANSLEISPGNLYYHFKGKEVIVQHLYQRFEDSLQQLLQAPLKQELQLEDAWYYLYLIFEDIYQYRFIYQDIGQLQLHYQTLAKRLRALIQLKFRTVDNILRQLCDANILTLSDLSRGTLTHSIVMTVMYWMAFEQMKGAKQTAEQTIHQGVFQVLSLLMPYLTTNAVELETLAINYYRERIDTQS